MSETGVLNKTALVVGGAGGVGRAVCHRLAEEGYDVLIADAHGLTETEAALAQHAARIRGTIMVDLREEASVAAMVRQVAELVPAIDALVIVAGVQQSATEIQSLETSDWDRVMDVNLRGPFLICKHVLPQMSHNAGASIVTVGSWWQYEGHAFFSAYCASKAGLRVFTQSMAAEAASLGIRVNLVAPGNIDTPMHHRAIEAEADARKISTAAMRDLEWEKIPMGKPADPLQIADVIQFLVSPESSYMTGATVDVNGGVVFR